jgi:WD40 repeat protein
MDNVKTLLMLGRLLRGKKSRTVDLGKREIEDAVAELLRRAKVANFSEFVRGFKYTRKGFPGQRSALGGAGPERASLSYKPAGELLGHSGHVDRVCFDRGGRFFLSGGADGMIKLWDAHSGLLVHSFIGHRSSVIDVCISSDGRLMGSCDLLGSLNIWSLTESRVLFNLRHGCEITFAEFFDTAEEGVYNLVLVLGTGAIRTYKFSRERMIEEKENLCLENEVIKNICISDGGRFIMCGGWWSFLVVFDTQALNGCILLETNGTPVNTICAARHCLKIAAACESLIFQWTFFAEGTSGMGNFKKRTKNNMLEGHWRKSVIRMELGENEFVERICYLRDNYLVCVCTDMRIRIYANTELRFVIESPGLGVVYAHPTENIFAFCGAHLRIYRLDKLIYEEVLSYTVNDAQFSNDGEFFICGDESGAVRVLSLGLALEAPREQFFVSDFQHINSLNESVFTECIGGHTIKINGERNAEWRPTEYQVTPSANRTAVKIEEKAAVHLAKDFITAEKFKAKYTSVAAEEAQTVETQPTEELSLESEELSSFATSIVADDSEELDEDTEDYEDTEEYEESGDYEESEEYEDSLDETTVESSEEVTFSSEDRILRSVGRGSRGTAVTGRMPRQASDQKRSTEKRRSLDEPMDAGRGRNTGQKPRGEEARMRMPRRRNLIESDEEDLATNGVKRLNASRANEETSGKSESLRLCRRSSPEPDKAGSIEDSGKKLEEQPDASQLGIGHRRSSSVGAALAPRPEEPSSQSLTQNEIELIQFVQTWLSSQAMIPQQGDVVYFNESALRSFQAFDTRRELKCSMPGSGFYEVESLKIVKYDPPFLRVTLAGGRASFSIKYYKYPNARHVLLLKEQHELSEGREVSFLMSDSFLSGTVRELDDVSLLVDTGIGSIVIGRDEALVPRDLFSPDTKCAILSLLERKRSFRNLYVTPRRESNQSYFASVVSAVNLGTVEQRVVYDLYRSIEGLEFDLQVVLDNSRHLGDEYYDYCKQLVDSIVSIVS